MWALTTVSSGINGAHAWDAGPKGWQGLVGALLAAAFPFMTLAAAHVVAGVALGPITDTETETDADANTESASAGQADAPALVGDLAPVALVVERAPALHTVDTETDTRTDRGHSDTVRTRTAPRGRVTERREEIVRLALTTDMSGRRIAESLGLDKTGVCALVREARAADFTQPMVTLSR
ncbi:hypothetical protein H1Q78_00090 [Cellulosimicrobium cellulans]|uniref:hypothetical protein n=1 Tax=Cellulosimicrobium cellulans TaxID=1710 RepID=UPI001EDA1F9B|nr:hypothetical protein [Cellulosimicrobium cellulans]UKJ63940.1 hypothetical protein H1Q78_00090 [Cellulosimicrobium cellulans]